MIAFIKMSSKGGIRGQLHRDHCLVMTLVSSYRVNVGIKINATCKTMCELLMSKYL